MPLNNNNIKGLNGDELCELLVQNVHTTYLDCKQNITSMLANIEHPELWLTLKKWKPCIVSFVLNTRWK